MTGLLVQTAYPLCKLGCVRHGSRQKDHLDGRGQENYTLLPHNSSLTILHVMNLIKYNPSNLLDHLGTPVEHGPEDLGRHDQACGIRLERHITRHQPDICELLAELPVLLVAQGLERGGVDDPLLVAERHGDGVLGDNGLPSRGVRGDEHRLVPLQARDGDALEGVELERVLLGHLPIELRACQRPVHSLVLGHLVALRDGDLVDARPGGVPALGRRVRLRLRRRRRRRRARILHPARVRRLALAGVLRLFPHREANLSYQTQRRVREYYHSIGAIHPIQARLR